MKYPSFAVPIILLFSVCVTVIAIRTGQLHFKTHAEITSGESRIQKAGILSRLLNESFEIPFQHTNSINERKLSILKNKNEVDKALNDIMISEESQGNEGKLTDSLIASVQQWSEQRNSNIDDKTLSQTSPTVSAGNDQLAGINYSIDQYIKGIGEHISSLKTKNDNNHTQLLFLLYGLFVLILILTGLYIIEKKKIKQTQSAKEERLTALLDAAPDATVIVNEQGKIIAVSKQVEHLFEYNRNDLIGMPVEILIDEELHKVHAGHRFNFMRHATVRVMDGGLELKARKKSGQLFPVEIYLSPVTTKEGLLVSASIRDISVTKKSQEKFRSLLESAPDATVIVDEKGEIQMINKQTEEVFQYSKEELIGQRVEILIPIDIRAKHIAHRADFAHSPRRRAMGEGLELKAVKKDGTLFPVEISLSPINTEDGMLISAAVRDITVRKTLEKELIKTNAELEAFTYSVSHDLRAPLRGIIGFTSMLEEDYTSKLDDEAKRLTGIIKSNTAKMGRLIDDLLAFSRMGKTEIVKEKIDSDGLVRDVVKEISQQYPNLNVNWQVKPLGVVRGDIQTIRQVWINLISNAVKYSGQAKEPVIIIDSFASDNQICFFVKDNGVGFNEQYKHKLFKVFQRLHDVSQFEGTGVGLALVEKIISRHGGRVWAEGKMNEGACFYFSLPI